MPRCKVQGCKVKSAVFGFVGEQPECCKSHTEKGMIDLINKRCEIDGCDIITCYGFKG
jgi:hypothetical protein